MTVAKRRGTVLDAPMATTCAGEVLFNVTHLDGMNDLIASIKKLVPPGQQLFVGVVVPIELRARVVKELDDAVVDVVGRVGTKLQRRRGAPP